VAADTDKLRLLASLPVSDSKPTLPKGTGSSPQPAARADNAKQDDYTNYSEEWVKAREATDKFDGNLFDLRKYGFSILTGLITAGSFLGFSTPTQFIQVGVIIVTMVLVVILYWLDIYYQGLLYGAVFRTRFLEIFRLNRGLSIYISALYGASHLGPLLHSLYLGFLIGVFLLGLFVANFAVVATDGDSSKNEAASAPANATESNRNQTFTDIKFWLNLGLAISFIFALGGIAAIYFLCHQSRDQAVKDISSLFKQYYCDWKNLDTMKKVKLVEEVERLLNKQFYDKKYL
jgi:hypothetical protein